jgi:hypothetical protein
MTKTKKLKTTDQDQDQRTLERYRSALAANEKSQEHRAATRAKFPETVEWAALPALARLDAEAAALRAEDELAVAGAERDRALHQDELAAGDPDAALVDVPRLIEQLEARLARHAELVALANGEIAAACDLVQLEVPAARAHIAQGRQAAGEPPPAAVSVVRGLSGTGVLLAETLASLRNRVTSSVEPRQHTARIARIEEEATTIRADLERAERERERRQREEDEITSHQEASEKRAVERKQEQSAEQSATRDAAEREQLELAEAYRQREAHGGVETAER